MILNCMDSHKSTFKLFLFPHVPCSRFSYFKCIKLKTKDKSNVFLSSYMDFFLNIAKIENMYEASLHMKGQIIKSNEDIHFED